MPASRPQTGYESTVITIFSTPFIVDMSSSNSTRISEGNNCNDDETDSAGCGVEVPTANSYGPPFNSAGGGWYAAFDIQSPFLWLKNDRFEGMH